MAAPPDAGPLGPARSDLSQAPLEQGARVLPTGAATASPPPPTHTHAGRPAMAPTAPQPVMPAGILGRDPANRAGTAGTVLSGLTTDPRMMWWIQRAVLAGLVGIIVTVTVDWRLGFTLAALTASLDAVYRSRVTAVIPAAARVSSAQRRTRWRLARLGPAGYLSLHARSIPGTDAVIDHLVAGPAGVYAIDSEHWDRRLPVRATQGGRLYHGPFNQAERLQTARFEAARASALLSEGIGQPVEVRPAMVIYGPTIPWIVVKIDGVDVLSGHRLRRYLRRQASATRGRHLDDRQVELIHTTAALVLPRAH